MALFNQTENTYLNTSAVYEWIFKSAAMTKNVCASVCCDGGSYCNKGGKAGDGTEMSAAAKQATACSI